MIRFSSSVLTLASLAAGLLVPTQSFAAASLKQVTRSDWVGSVTLPSYLQMYVYVPDAVAAKPPIMISAHSCGSTATGQMANIPKSQAAADKNGFILILPDNQPQNCWDVGAANSLKHDGGGDTQGIATMVKYAITKYNADPARVYVQGGSGGAMLVQALLAVYPDVFRAGMARAGVPAGCWADGYDASQQWSNNCAGGKTTKTAQQWGDLVRAMDPGYTGHRPRLQTMQGTMDTTVSYNNTAEAIKEWTNVLGLSTEPTTTDKGYQAASAKYDRQFWANACGYNVLEVRSSPGGTHSMPYEEDDMLKFFGLDKAGGADPEPDCAGMGGAPATGGMGGMSSGGSSAGGAPPVGGMGGVGGMGVAGAPPAGGMGGLMAAAGTGGAVATGGGGTGAGGRPNGGAPAMGGTGGAPSGTGGTTTSVAGGTGKAGSVGTGAAGTGTGGDSTDPAAPAGCGCAVGDSKHSQAYSALLALGLGAMALRRRQRRARS